MEIDFGKMGGLVPAIIQDNVTGKVLMVGFMNQEAYDKTGTREGDVLQPNEAETMDQGRGERKLS